MSSIVAWVLITGKFEDVSRTGGASRGARRSRPRTVRRSWRVETSCASARTTVELGDGGLLTVYYQKVAGDEKASLLCSRWRLPGLPRPA